MLSLKRLVPQLDYILAEERARVVHPIAGSSLRDLLSALPPADLNCTRPGQEQATRERLATLLASDRRLADAVDVYSRWMQDIDVAPFPLTVGKVLLLFISRLPMDAIARQALEDVLKLCNHVERWEGSFDQLGAALGRVQVELQTMYPVPTNQLLRNDPLVLEMTKLSRHFAQGGSIFDPNAELFPSALALADVASMQ